MSFAKLAVLILIASLCCPVALSAEHELAFYQQQLDVQVRYDHRSDRENRSQYRLRFYPQLNFDEQWSLHSFAVTGDEFSSSHNTFGDSGNVAVRRLYLRHTYRYGKTEIGVIPTYKGRVSATGLSKDGWFQGIRHVYEFKKGHQFEMVAGAINTIDPDKALSLAEQLNLFELEYSGQINNRFSTEFGFERMIDGNYARTELRYHHHPKDIIFAELVHRLDAAENKLVIGIDAAFRFNNYPVGVYAYYAYVSNEFGPRAELTEDYLGTGHGGSIAFSGALPLVKLNWFSRIDVVDNTRRVLVGLKRSF